jgi:hypothetical protein
MKKSLLDAEARAALVERIGQIQPDAPRQWGKMNAAQCLCHLADAFRMALGTLKVADRSSFLSRTLIKTVVLSGMPVPKGKAQTAPEIDQLIDGTKPTTFEADRKLLLDELQAFLATSENYPFVPHAFFGPLSRNQWGKLLWAHIDHHLMQFGA